MGAVAVENIDAVIDAVEIGVMDCHDLVKAGPVTARQRDCGFGGHNIAAATHVNDDNVVAQSVHLGKRNH